MNTNKNKTTKSKTQKQPAASEAENTLEAKTIKLGIDVHLDRYVVVRIIDGGTPQPPRRFEPAEFLLGQPGKSPWLRRCSLATRPDLLVTACTENWRRWEQPTTWCVHAIGMSMARR